MKDRTPTKVLPNGAIRYEIYDETGQFLRYDYIKLGDEPTREGTPLNKDTMLSDATEIEIFGNAADRTVDDALIGVYAKSNSKSLLRDLNIMLNLSLGTSNIDAWADVFEDSEMIDTALSTGYKVSSSRLSRDSVIISQTNHNRGDYFGKPSYQKMGQTFIPRVDCNFESIRLKMYKNGSPNDYIRAKLYASNKTTRLATSTNKIYASAIGTSSGGTYVTFDFRNVRLDKDTTYFVEIERSSALSDSNYYYILGSDRSTSYDDGQQYYWNGSSWRTRTYDMHFYIIILAVANVRWKAVTPTEALKNIAVCANLSGSSGVDFYLSNDGTTWTPVPNLNTAQEVNFTDAPLHLKCILDGVNYVGSVAWGGY